MHLIYVSGSNPATDKALIAQIRRLPVGARLAEAANAADAITEVRKVAGAKIAILLSPTLGETDIVPLILDVRYEAKAVAVIGLGDGRRAFRLLVAGADAVLEVANGTLVNAEETIKRLSAQAQPVELRERPSEADPQLASQGKLLSGLRKLSTLVS